MPTEFQPPSWKYEPQTVRRARAASAVRRVADQVSPLVASGQPLDLLAAQGIADAARRQNPEQQLTRQRAMGQQVGQDVRKRLTGPPLEAEGGSANPLGSLASAWRSTVPQVVRDVLGRTLRGATSAESALNYALPGDPGTAVGEFIERTPVIGDPLRVAFDAGLSPLSLATAGWGGAAAGAIGGTSLAARGARAVVAPLTRGGFKQNLTAEIAAALGGTYGSRGAGALAEELEAPDWARVAAEMVGGLAGGVGGVGAVSAVRGGAKAMAREATERALREADPKAFEAGRGQIDIERVGEPGSPRYERGSALPEDLIPRATVVEPSGQVAGGIAGGATEPRRLSRRELTALRKKAAEGTLTDDDRRTLMEALGRTMGATTADEQQAALPWNREEPPGPEITLRPEVAERVEMTARAQGVEAALENARSLPDRAPEDDPFARFEGREQGKAPTAITPERRAEILARGRARAGEGEEPWRPRLRELEAKIEAEGMTYENRDAAVNFIRHTAGLTMDEPLPGRITGRHDIEPTLRRAFDQTGRGQAGSVASVSSETGVPDTRTSLTVTPEPRTQAPSRSTSTTASEPSLTSRATTPSTSTTGPISSSATGSTSDSILHQGDDASQLLLTAREAEPEVRETLGSLFGAGFIGSRVKGEARLREKLGERSAAEVSDYLGARVVADDLEDAVAVLSERYRIVRDRTVDYSDQGYRARHLQVEVRPGFTAEVQVQEPRIAAAQEFARGFYESARTGELPLDELERLDAAMRYLYANAPDVTPERAAEIQRAFHAGDHSPPPELADVVRRARTIATQGVPDFPLQGGLSGGAMTPEEAAARIPREQWVSPGEVTTRPDLFQARDAPLGEATDPRRVRQIVENFEPSRFEPITVARSGDGYVVISGHHRLEAAREIGLPEVPVRVLEGDISTPEARIRLQNEAALSNFLVAPNNVREQIRAFRTLEANGMSIDEIAGHARTTAGAVERALDIGRAGPAVVERVVSAPALSDIASEVGRAVRLHGISEEDAQGVFDALVQRGRGQTLPTPLAVRAQLDALAPAFTEPTLPGFGGDFSATATPLYEAVRAGAKLQDELATAQRRLTRDLAGARSLAEREGVDIAALEAIGERELNAIRGQLDNLHQSVMERVRAQAAAQQQPRVQGQATLDEAPVQQQGPRLFDAEQPPPPPREPSGAADLPNYGRQGEFEGMPTAASKRGGIWENVRDIATLPRALIASGDVSATARQMAKLGVRNPEEYWHAIRAQLDAFRSEEAARATLDAIYNHPRAWALRKAKVSILDPFGEADAGLREEAFISRFAGDLPLVKQSNRAYTTGLDDLRANVFYKWLSGFTDDELRAKSDEWFEQIGAAVDAFSGRGRLGEYLEKHAATLNAGLFSPRFLASQFQAPLALFSKNEVVRKQAAQSLAAFYGTGLTLIGLAAASGLSVGFDPRSSDFGKVTLPGGTRVDIWGGQAQVARMLANLASGDVVSARTGQQYDQPRMQTMARFLRSKLAPVPSLAVSLYQGEDPTGEQLQATPRGFVEQAIRLVTPLFVQETVDAMRNVGLVEGAAAGALSAVGVGAQSYERGAADEAAQAAFGKPYARLTGPERGELAALHPELSAALIKEQATAGGRSGEAGAVRQQTRTEQEASDRQLLDGRLTRQQWLRQRSDRLLEQRAKLEQVYGEGKPITDAEAARDPLKRYLQAIQQATDPETGAVDSGEVARVRAGWGEAVNAAIDRSLGTSETPLSRLYRQAADGYYGLPRYRGYSADEGRQIDALWSEVRAQARSAEAVDMQRALRKVLAAGGHDAKIVGGVRRRIGGSLERAPDRGRAASRDPVAAFFFGSKQLSPSQRAQFEERLRALTGEAVPA